MRNKIFILVALAPIFVLGLFLINLAIAQESSAQSTSTSQQNTQEKQQEAKRQEEYKEALNRAKAANIEAEQKTQEKKEQAKKNICEKIKDRTKNRHEHIKTMTGEIASRIDQRVERAKSFVASKNLQVENYGVLLADINAKKQAVASARATIASAVGNFDCNSDNRKVQEATIREKVEAYKVAIKAYKQSVKTFLQAVKVAAQAELSTPSASPSSSGGSQEGASQ